MTKEEDVERIAGLILAEAYEDRLERLLHAVSVQASLSATMPLPAG